MVSPDKAAVKLLLEKARKTPYAAVFWTLAATGVRRGEVLAIRRDHVDLDRGVPSVTGAVSRHDGKIVVSATMSTASRRALHFDPETVDVLRSHLAAQAEHRLGLGSAHQTRV